MINFEKTIYFTGVKYLKDNKVLDIEIPTLTNNRLSVKAISKHLNIPKENIISSFKITKRYKLDTKKLIEHGELIANERT